MLLQDILTQRIILLLIVQVWPIFYGSFIGYKILKRTKNRATFSLSALFFLTSITYFFATISIFFLNTPFAYIFYIIGIYFYVFGHCFFVIFSWVLVKLDEKAPNWKFYLTIIFYGFISTYVFWIGYYFNGIKYDASTTWLPNYSFFFLIFSWIFILTFIVIPQIYFSFKLVKVFEGIILKRRINMFIISVVLELTVVFLLFLYHFWHENQIFRTIVTIIMPVTSTIAALLIYNSFGKELK